MYPYFSSKRQLPKPICAKELADYCLTTHESTSKISDIILISIKNEEQDKCFYENLIPLMEEKDKAIINGIILDETKHAKLLTHIYKLLNNSEPEKTTPEECTISENLAENIEDAVLDEAEAIKLYRELMLNSENSEIRDLFFEIMTDEATHLSLMTFLYNKYR